MWGPGHPALETRPCTHRVRVCLPCAGGTLCRGHLVQGAPCAHLVQEAPCPGGTLCRRHEVPANHVSHLVQDTCRGHLVQTPVHAGGHVSVQEAPCAGGTCAGGTLCRRHLVQEAPCAHLCRRHLVQEAPCAGGTLCRRHLVQEAPCAGGTLCRRHLVQEARSTSKPRSGEVPSPLLIHTLGQIVISYLYNKT